MGITAEERHFIRHALGLTRQKVGYRNFYRAGGDSVHVGRSLVRKGMAIELPPSDGLPPEPLFLISSAGFRAAAKQGEMMDKEEAQKMQRIDQRAYVGA